MELDPELIKTIKSTIKEFETTFESTHHRKPTKEEIAQQPKIHKYYKIYSKLKRSNTKDQNDTNPTNPKESSGTNSRTWSKVLNKTRTVDSKNSLTGGGGVGDDDNFTLITSKIRKLNEERYIESTKCNKPFTYSLRYRQKQLFEKSKIISTQLQLEKQASNNDDEFTTETESLNANSLEKGLADLDLNFALDDVNEFIKNSILDNDTLMVSELPTVENERKRVYDIEDDCRNKRFKPDPLPPVEDIQCSTDALSTEIEPVSNQKTKKFFKSKPNTQYDARLFFDHHKELDFEPTANDQSILKNLDANPKITPVELLPSPEPIEKGKPSSKPGKKMKNENYRKLSMKKKTFMSRGYKKFNMKQYKYKSWKKNKKSYKCFKCGEPDHFAAECTNIPNVNENELDPVFDDKYEADKQHLICLNKPLFSDIDDPELEKLVTESLIEFGYEAFRPNQKETVKRILCGKSTLLISPTGFGKSLCYQLAAYCFWKVNHLITIVISPLISLMQDQLLNFPDCLKAVCVNSSQGDKEKNNSIDAIITGRAQVLFLSPECIVNGLHSINFAAFARVAFVCIDEAHCLAEWSVNFRPSYLHLYKILHLKLNIRTILSMTATVTKDTLKMICKNLELNCTTDVLGSTKVPDNLILTASRENNKIVALIDLLQSERFKKLNSIIIYCTRREQTEQIESYIRTSLQFDVARKDINNLVRSYHAGLSSFNRTQIQKNFISGKLRIVVATIAFGMGINKKNIRAIIHYNMPKSFENYIQEIGRAGRDGQPSYCHLFIDNDGEDLFGLQNFIYQNGVDKPNLRKLVANIYQPCKCQSIAEISEVDKATCPGHPVALPIVPTEVLVDLKSENIYTILMCLEMEYCEFPIQVLTPTNSMCTITNYGDDTDMAFLIKDNVTLHMAALMAKKDIKSFNLSNFKFSIFEVARMLGKGVSEVKSELKKLEWKVENGRKRKSAISVRFTDFAYHIRAVGNLSEFDIEQVVTYLYGSIEKMEQKQVYKLRYLYSKFSEFCLQDEECEDVIREKSDQLKQFIDSYFQSDQSEQLDMSSLQLPYTFDMSKQDTGHIQSVISEMIHFYYENGVNTPRKMARILQGISSPKYPAEIWGKVHQYWRSVFKIDFHDLMELCREALVNNYSIK